MDRDGRGAGFDMARPKQRSDQERLPPLSEVLPELRNSGSQDPPQGQYSRTLSHIPAGPPPFPDAHSLTPTPLNKPSGYAPSHSPSSSASLSSASRGSPALPSVHALHNSGSQYRDPRNLPPIYTNGADDPQRRASGYHESMSPGASGPPGGPPAYMVNGMRPPEYGAYGARPPPPYPNGAVNFESMGDYVDGKQKKRRGNLPKPVTDVLRLWFAEHIAHPYPTEDEKQMLMARTGLTISQISNWFINARRRSLPQMNKQAQTESDLRDGQRG